jgi:hypothetical protein
LRLRFRFRYRNRARSRFHKAQTRLIWGLLFV